MNRRTFMASLAALVSTRLFGGKAEAATLTDTVTGWETNRWLNGPVTVSGNFLSFSVTGDGVDQRRFIDSADTNGTFRLEHDYHLTDWKFDVRCVD